MYYVLVYNAEIPDPHLTSERLFGGMSFLLKGLRSIKIVNRRKEVKLT
jgi:hypothetical protein